MKGFLMMSLILASGAAFAQGKTVTGKVTDTQSGEALPGVNVVVKGTSQGTITDVDGKYSLQISSDDDVLIFSFIGYKREEIAVAGRTSVDVPLAADITSLEEVVVVGYGEQKKSVVTGAIASVKASELESMPVNRIEQSLQGRTAGLTIAQSSGQPGSSATVRVRGVTTFSDGGNNDPLYIVDGVQVDVGGIGYLNQSDIESIEVLKDASSQAIYGARAANGVVLVTTKKGKSGVMSFNYNGYIGVSEPARKLDLLNATEYATIRNEAAIAAGQAAPFADPASLGEGTDWQEQIFNTAAKRQSHDFSISGGSEKSTFYTSVGFLEQEGIVASEISRYRRINIRLNSTHKLNKYISVGQTLGFANTKSSGLGNTNSEFGGPLSSAINLDPLTPVVETDPVKASQGFYTNPNALRDANGNPYGISSQVGQEMSNPVAYTKTRLGNYGWANDFVGNAYIQIEPMTGLKLRSTLGGKLAFWGNEGFTPTFLLNGSTSNTQNSINRGMNRVFNWNIENTISYTKAFDKHEGTILLGQGGYYDGKTYGANITFFNVPFTDLGGSSFGYKVPAASRNADGSNGDAHTLTSLFARLNYAYDEKYLLTAIIRRDGSANFGANKKYGYFPSFSAGWVVSRENIWPANNVVNFLKIRGGYGVVGNDNIGRFRYLPLIDPGRNYTIGNGGAVVVGNSPAAPANPNLQWEETSQLNIGFEATVLNDFTVSFDWYKKKTSKILEYPKIPNYIGSVGDPAANAGDMNNTGVEFELGYKRQFGDLKFSANGNIGYVKNEVVFLANGIPFRYGPGFQNMGAITRNEAGHAFNSFYGFRTLGIFQNMDEVQAYTNAEGNLIQPDAKPGDFIWEDISGDGTIGDDDRTYIGDPTPNVTYGITLNLAWKGFDFMVFGQGVAGNQIFQGLRRLDIGNANWQSKILDRWHGEGTSNTNPRVVVGDPNKNYNRNSSYYLEDGDYFRLKVVQVGYSLPAPVVSKVGLNKVRVYLMSENLLTFTKYTGYDPEIGGNTMSIDRGIYPQARSFMVGLNVGF